MPKVLKFLKGLLFGVPVGMLTNWVLISQISPLSVKSPHSDLYVILTLLVVDVLVIYVVKRRFKEIKTVGFATGLLISVPVSLVLVLFFAVSNMRYMN